MKIYVFAPTYAAGRMYVDAELKSEDFLTEGDFSIVAQGRAEQHLRGRRMHAEDMLVFLEGFQEGNLDYLAMVCLTSTRPETVVWLDSRSIEQMAPWLIEFTIPDLQDQKAVAEWLAS